MTLRYTLYASTLIEPMGRDALNGLLRECRTRNADKGLTGFLHIENRIVLQYLEGPASALKEILSLIERDRRHTDFAILAQDELAVRYFEQWQMALVDSTTLSLLDLLGVQNLEVPDVRRINPLDLISLLTANASFLRSAPALNYG